MPPSIYPTTIDFETRAIESRPTYPPEPIGVSIKLWGRPSHYYAWGHKTNNNCTKAQAVKALKAAVKGGPTLYHHAKFDTDVMETKMGIPMPRWQDTHDTTFLLFLHDPNMKNIGLKPSAEEILGWPSDEKDMLGDWLCANQPVPGVKISKGPKSDSYFMKFLEWAPGDLTGTYAAGDTDRTEALFEKLYESIIARGMSEAYDRERRLMPVLLAMEKRGVRVDLPKLRSDVALYQGVQKKIDEWLIDRFSLSRFFNLDSKEFVEVLIAAGVADRDLLGVTVSGQTATNKLAIAAGVADKQIGALLQYRAQLHTCLAVFLTPWLAMAEASEGFIFTTWNQVRGDNKGARTGRLSSSPNFQNLPRSFKPLFQHEKKGLPKTPIKALPPLPLCRSYIIPYRDDHILIDRDWSQNEIRILAHFGDGALLAKYLENVWMDVHEMVRLDLKATFGKDVERTAVKTLNFALLYGMGIGTLAERLGVTVDEAKKLKKSVLALYPEVDDLYKTMRQLAKEEQPLVTWGGREAYCEPPTKDKKTGKLIDWSYKMPNVLIQGSAGDGAKESAIRYADTAPADHLLLLTVHDEYLVSVPRCDLKRGHDILRAAMEGLDFDIPMLSEGKWGVNWAELKTYDKAGVVVDHGAT